MPPISKTVAGAAFLPFLCACGTSALDGVKIAALASQNEAILVVSARLSARFNLCQAVWMEITRLDGPTRKRPHIAVKDGPGLNRVVQKKVEAGRYGITNFVCEIANVPITLQPAPHSFEPARPYRIYGTFELRKGEVVSIGQVSIVAARGRFSRLASSPLTQDQVAWFAENRPKLSARMVARPFQPTLSPRYTTTE